MYRLTFYFLFSITIHPLNAPFHLNTPPSSLQITILLTTSMNFLSLFSFCSILAPPNTLPHQSCLPCLYL